MKNFGIKFLWLVAAGFCFISLTGADYIGSQILERSKNLMGTSFEIKVFESGLAPDQLSKIVDEAFVMIEGLENTLSSFKETGTIAQANRAKAGEATRLDKDSFYILSKADEISRASEGAFDVTVWPLKRLWMEAKEKAEPPSLEIVTMALQNVGHQNIELDANQQVLRLKKEGVQVDLGGIAKGYAVDVAAHFLEESGVRSAIISGGGNIYIVGQAPESRGWRIGIDHPRRIDEYAAVMELPEEFSISTSGDYEDFLIYKGKRYGHIFDPRTGFPPDNRVVSVTVIAKNGTLADALSTAFFVLGPEKGFDLIERYAVDDKAAAVCIEEMPDGELVLSSSDEMQPYLKDVQL